jgi:hypothetical protein
MLRQALAVVLALAAASARADTQPASAPAPPADEPTPLEGGVASFQDGDFEGAARALEQARARDPDDPDAGLLLGITYYRLHRAADAEPLLAQGAASADAETAASARIFLALIALERDDERRAHALLDRVAASPSTELAASARALIDRSQRAPLSLFAMVRPEFDSNVPLLPTAPTAGAVQADADFLVLGAITDRPIRGVPFQLEATLSYRQQAQLTDFDFLAGVAALGYDDGALDVGASGEAMGLGSSFYGAGAGGQIGYHLDLDAAVTPWARYGLRYRDYEPADYTGYTGFTHSGALGLGIGRRGTVSADVDGLVLRELTSDAALVATGVGAGAALRVRFASVSLVGGGTVTWRAFDLGRRDLQTALDASVALDITSGFGVVAGATLLDNDSSLAEAVYLKVTAFAGVYVAASP